MRDGNSVHAPAPLPADRGRADGSNVRAGAHEDINAITLLLGAEEAGLELLTRDGRWIPVVAQARRAGRQYRRHAAAADQRPAALDHPPRRQPAARARGKSRYSMPFFLHFRSDFLIEALPGTVPAGEQPKWPPITANDYLQERLREIKLV